jgi:hypothetical protein
MKANVPEKLYFGEADNVLLDIYSTKESDNEVEYICTNVFIEKACEWIMNHFRSEGFGSPLYYKGLLYRPEDIVEDFKKAMKGE